MGFFMKSKAFEGCYSGSYGRLKCLRTDIYEYLKNTTDEVNDGTVSFLHQDDTNIKLSPKECGELLSDIADMKSNYKYGGLAGTDQWLTIDVFKQLLKCCHKKRNNLYFY